VKGSALPPIVRDVVLLGLGSFLLIWQCVVVDPGKANPWIIGAALGCLGITGNFGLKYLREAGRQGTLDTRASSSVSPSQSQSQPELPT
jgi:hypothetical protein